MLQKEIVDNPQVKNNDGTDWQENKEKQSASRLPTLSNELSEYTDFINKIDYSIIDKKESLLKVKDVADLLSVSERTVYERSAELGGFYPAGIKVLRFSRKVIYGIMEGQDPQRLALRIPVQRETVRRGRPCKQAGSNIRKRNAPEGNQGRIKTDPSRHGL